MTTIKTLVLLLAVLTSSSLFATARAAETSRDLTSAQRVFEMRTYHALPGRLDALNKRFRDHTCKLFQKHGMELIGFWTPQDEKQGKADTLVYILAYPSREAAAASWKAFHNDPDWKKARDESEKDGKIVAEVESVFLDPTDYSEIK